MTKKIASSLLLMAYGIVLLGLAIYSFSQIDLNLTLSSNSFYQSFQKTMIWLGYFNRSLSTIFFVILIFLLTTFYLLLLALVKKGKLTERQIWLLIGLTVIIVFLAYPAFSHDVFNYMFDARIVTTYGLSPYEFRALDFPNDLWIRFMHWTHRYYPYGPTWLLLTLPLSWLGLGKFTLTLLNFKLLFSVLYLGNVYLINKILAKISPEERLLGLAFFAFNPLVIIEGLLSPHNESAMLFFLLLSIYLLLLRKKWLVTVSLLISGGIKFLTLIFLPIFWFWRGRDWFKFIKIQSWVLILSLLAVIWVREPYAWYFLTLVGLVALVTRDRLLFWLTLAISLGTLLRYAPFLYFGNYQAPVPQIQLGVTIVPIIMALIIFLLGRKASI